MNINKQVTGYSKSLINILVKVGLSMLIFVPLSTNAQVYQVKYGDSLSKIASNYSITVQQIVESNKIKNPSLILVGQKLIVSGAKQNQEKLFGATPSDPTANQSYNPPTGYQSILTSYIAGNAATIPVVTTKDLSGNAINLANISQAAIVKVYMTLEPGNPTNQEEIMCTGVTASSWTNCTRGLPFQGGSETASTTLQKSHNAGAVIIITNISQFYNQYLSVDGNQTVNNVKTFTQIPLAPTTTPTNPQQLITLYQFQQATSTGGINGSETVKGVWQGASRTQMAAGTNVGSTGANLALQSQYASSTSPGVTTIVVTNGSGKVDSSFGGTASGLATTNGSNLVVQNPADTSVTPTANFLPIADASGTIRQWDYGFVGDGSNGAESILSGTTTISAANSTLLVENFTSLNIASSSVLNFSAPSSTGTIVLIKVQGNCTVSGTINLVGMGATTATNGFGTVDTVTHYGTAGVIGAAGSSNTSAAAGGNQLTNTFFYTSAFPTNIFTHSIFVAAGAGGNIGGQSHGGSGTPGTAGRGGGGFILQCGGTLNFSGNVILDGSTGGTSANVGGGSGGDTGMGVMIANKIGINTGTFSAKGGAGGGGGYSGLNESNGSGASGPGCFTSSGATGGTGGYNSGATAGSVGSAGCGSAGGGGAGNGGGGGPYTPGSGGAASASDTNAFSVILNTVL